MRNNVCQPRLHTSDIGTKHQCIWCGVCRIACVWGHHTFAVKTTSGVRCQEIFNSGLLATMKLYHLGGGVTAPSSAVMDVSAAP